MENIEKLVPDTSVIIQGVLSEKETEEVCKELNKILENLNKRERLGNLNELESLRDICLVRLNRSKKSIIDNIIRIKDKEGLFWLYDKKVGRCFNTDDIKLKNCIGIYNAITNSVMSIKCLLD